MTLLCNNPNQVKLDEVAKHLLLSKITAIVRNIFPGKDNKQHYSNNKVACSILQEMYVLLNPAGMFWCLHK